VNSWSYLWKEETSTPIPALELLRPLSGRYWGPEDFMDIKKSQASDAANLSLFMVAFPQFLLPQTKGLDGGGILDLKTVSRARKYTRCIINSLGIN
jgi:hypothetical protein